MKKLMCCKCRKTKLPRYFTPNDKLDGGFIPWCKACCRKLTDDPSDLARKLYMRDYMRLYMRKTRSTITKLRGYFRVMVRDSDHADAGRWPMVFRMIYCKRRKHLKITASRRCEDWALDIMQRYFRPKNIEQSRQMAGSQRGRPYNNHVKRTLIAKKVSWKRVQEGVAEINERCEVVPLERMGYKRRYETKEVV